MAQLVWRWSCQRWQTAGGGSNPCWSTRESQVRPAERQRAPITKKKPLCSSYGSTTQPLYTGAPEINSRKSPKMDVCPLELKNQVTQSRGVWADTALSQRATGTCASSGVQKVVVWTAFTSACHSEGAIFRRKSQEKLDAQIRTSPSSRFLPRMLFVLK